MALPVQVLPPQDNQFASSLGTGLSNLLVGLAQGRAQQMQRRSTLSGLEAIGIPGQEAQAISGLSPELQNLIVKNYLQTAPQEAGLTQALGSISGQAPLQTEQAEQSLETAQPQQSKSFAELLRNPRLKPEHRLQIEKMAQQERQFQTKESAKERREAFAQSKETRKKTHEAAHAARQDIRDLDRMGELEKEGKLDTPGYVEFLKRSGLDIPALMNPGSEEFNKTAANFMRNAKTYLGSRISNFELDQFLKTIPSLSQSPEGRKRVISNLKYVARSALSYNDALNEIIKENKGVPPLDLDEQIEDRVGNKLDKLSEKFKEDISKPVPKGQNKFITGLQATAGSVLGAPGALLKGAGSLLSGLAL